MPQLYGKKYRQEKEQGTYVQGPDTPLWMQNTGPSRQDSD